MKKKIEKQERHAVQLTEDANFYLTLFGFSPLSLKLGK